jgi:hypothetical protein
VTLWLAHSKWPSGRTGHKNYNNDNKTLTSLYFSQQNLMSPMVPPASQSALQNSLMGPATPGPMTPMTPSSADPGIVPQLQ